MQPDQTGRKLTCRVGWTWRRETSYRIRQSISETQIEVLFFRWFFFKFVYCKLVSTSEELKTNTMKLFWCSRIKNCCFPFSYYVITLWILNVLLLSCCQLDCDWIVWTVFQSRLVIGPNILISASVFVVFHSRLIKGLNILMPSSIFVVINSVGMYLKMWTSFQRVIVLK